MAADGWAEVILKLADRTYCDGCGGLYGLVPDRSARDLAADLRHFALLLERLNDFPDAFPPEHPAFAHLIDQIKAGPVRRHPHPTDPPSTR